MYLCINIATYLHTVYLDWQHAVIVSNSRCAWGWRSSELSHTLLGRDQVSLEMQLETEIEWTQRCTGLEMHFEAVIERVWRCIWRPRLSDLRDALGGSDGASLEMRWEAVFDRVWRCTLGPWSSEIGDAIWDCDWVNSEMHSELWSSELRDALAAGYNWGRFEEYLI